MVITNEPCLDRLAATWWYGHTDAPAAAKLKSKQVQPDTLRKTTHFVNLHSVYFGCSCGPQSLWWQGFIIQKKVDLYLISCCVFFWLTHQDSPALQEFSSWQTIGLSLYDFLDVIAPFYILMWKVLWTELERSCLISSSKGRIVNRLTA